ncbi:MAG: mannose-1-phosphate guanylyltransferase [Bacteroidales bacterium]|nr:mannose-1-phosphate guanylyltransferase [Bacteroidales bacterium]MBQ3521415.1 mannose-1-phosphate guanylyltransferase [Bacteroidales bacterium]MBQ7997756.1 mannose-1-phosphate guanylyltransferase [Bacteroidales bacterium]
MSRENNYCIIMAGGIGSRFWPISRNSRPKQFLDILGTGSSFLQDTFRRFQKIIPVENIIVVTSEQYGALVKEQLPLMKDENILLEPHRRNTAPCIAYATYKLLKKNPNANVVVAPSDHLIINEDLFLETIESALEYASAHDHLFTLGIKPTRPETGYGYIQINKGEKMEINRHAAYGVKTFTEKPDAELAKVLVESGEFLWNSGIFVWNLKAISRELERHLPEIANSFKDGGRFYYTPEERDYIKGIYEACNGISIDYGVMEKTDKSWVFEASFGWSDLGTWHSLYCQSNRDENENMVQAGAAMLDGVKESLIVTECKDKLVVVKGLENYMIVDTADVLMICPRNESDFKNVTTDLTVNELNKYQ